MRLLLSLLLVLATVGVGCSSGPSLYVPMQEEPLSIERLVLVTEQASVEIDEPGLVTDAFDLEGDVPTAYLKLFGDSLAASLEDRTLATSVTVRVPHSMPIFEETRVRSERRTRSSSVPSVYATSVKLPPAGTTFAFEGDRPPWVLLIDELRVIEQKGRMSVGGIPGASGPNSEPGLILDVRYVLWDNTEARPVKAGRVRGFGEEHGGLLNKEIDEESFADAITDVARILTEDVPLAEK